MTDTYHLIEAKMYMKAGNKNKEKREFVTLLLLDSFSCVSFFFRSAESSDITMFVCIL